MFPARFCITYKYGENAPLALDDINFSIQKGKVTAIVGPSGCGKTTLVEIFSGVIPKLIGNGVLSGSFDIPDDALVSVVSQNPENQLFGYGVEDAIAFGLENIGMPQEQISERMEYVLDLLNLQYLRKRSVSNLSGGQRQAVCIASVLAMSPDILIMDEPVSSLDPNGKALVRSILVQLSADNNTVVVVDNNLSWFAGIVDHVIGLLDGKVVFDGDRDTFFRDFELHFSATLSCRRSSGSSFRRKSRFTARLPGTTRICPCFTPWRKAGGTFPNCSAESAAAAPSRRPWKKTRRSSASTAFRRPSATASMRS